MTKDADVELTDHASEKDHSKARHQEHSSQPFGEAPEFGVCNRSPRALDDEHEQDYHELTSKDVALEIVALVDELRAHVRVLVGVLEEIFVNGNQADNGSLSTFDHGQPSNRKK